jgi:endonuclease/exonuclease/phosphatase (EEP) superfamily protein YafD
VLFNGTPSNHHDKMAQIYKLGALTVANTQMLPMGIFGKDYATGEARELASEIEDVLLGTLQAPLVFCGDFNFNSVASLYPRLCEKLTLRDALPDMLTRPNIQGIKSTPDHILASDDIKVLDASVVPGRADHYLCTARITTRL